MDTVWRTWKGRTIEASIPAINVNAHPKKVVAHFRGFLEDAPVTIVDVGTRGGIPRELESLAPHLEVVAFEPDPDETSRLEDSLKRLGVRSARVLPVAIGPPNGEFALRVTREPGRSSLLEPNREVIQRYSDDIGYEVIRTTPVRTRALGAVLAEVGIDAVDFLKVDVQGFELEVLKTLTEGLWQHLLFVETEVEFVELYKGQPLFRHIDELLAAKGFELFNLARVFANYGGGRWEPYGRGQLQFAEAYYLRTQVELLPPRQIAKLIVLSAYYGFNDYGYFLFRYHAERLRELGSTSIDLFRDYFAPFSARRPLLPRVFATGLRLVLDRALFLYLVWRRWNGLKTDTDRAYPFR